MARMLTGRLGCYECFMQQTPEQSRVLAEDAFCVGCRCHRPKWKYRFCAYTECPQMKGFQTFREKYLEE
jgi:hypothetical protein